MADTPNRAHRSGMSSSPREKSLSCKQGCCKGEEGSIRTKKLRQKYESSYLLVQAAIEIAEDTENNKNSLYPPWLIILSWLVFPE